MVVGYKVLATLAKLWAADVDLANTKAEWSPPIVLVMVIVLVPIVIDFVFSGCICGASINLIDAVESDRRLDVIDTVESDRRPGCNWH